MTAPSHRDVLDRALKGHSPSAAEALALADCDDLPLLMADARPRCATAAMAPSSPIRARCSFR